MLLNTHQIKSFIDLNIKEIRSVHCVARLMNVSYETLRKTFLRVERIPLAEYIAAKKVEVIKEHLLVANDLCYVICYEYGMREDTGAKVFKRATGMTMRQFRLRYFQERTMSVSASAVQVSPRKRKSRRVNN